MRVRAGSSLDIARLACGAAVLCSLAAGCASEDLSADGAIRRDSAGVELVEQSAPLHDSLAWTISAEPTVLIGARLRGPDDILFRVRGAVRLRDGRIVVANGGTHEVRFYAADGRLERSVGGEGEGPASLPGSAPLCSARRAASTYSTTVDVSSPF